LKKPASKGTILVAEDDNFVRRVIARILEKAGYEVLEAADGRSALDVVCDFQGQIHLLLTDFMMPKLNGRQLADISISLRPGLKVLYTSTFTDEMMVIQGVIEPGMAFIDKKFLPETLVRKVSEVLSGTSPEPNFAEPNLAAK
jgi:two-component system cell cycle sensor histidine kinase/response regulator CckA